MKTPIATLNLGSRLERKLAPIAHVEGLLALGFLSLMSEWRITAEEMATINAALDAAGQPRIEIRTAKPPKPPKDRSCGVDMTPDEPTSAPCSYPKAHGKRVCIWHWLMKQPVGDQITAADQRRAANVAMPGWVERTRVSPKDWPAGERWCSECQGFAPLFYVSGSKCYAHGSRASHASMLKHVYDLSPEEYEQLLAWQGGRCYVCGQVPRVRRLAVDHDHVSGEVRGLLCANDEWGCNVLLRRMLGNVPMAERALAYAQKTPIDRMRAGEPPVVYKAAPKAPRPPAARESRPDDEWDPFG